MGSRGILRPSDDLLTYVIVSILNWDRFLTFTTRVAMRLVKVRIWTFYGPSKLP